MADVRALRGIDAAPASTSARIVFCGHCGRPAEDNTMPEVGSRVCRRCNLGLLLTAPEGLAPKPGEAFLVVDAGLAMVGLSRRAEKLLGVREVDVVDRPVTDYLVVADAERAAGQPSALPPLLAAATAGAESTETIVVRPVDEFGVRFTARCSPCGPAPGALLILDASF